MPKMVHICKLSMQINVLHGSWTIPTNTIVPQAPKKELALFFFWLLAVQIVFFKVKLPYSLKESLKGNPVLHIKNTTVYRQRWQSAISRKGALGTANGAIQWACKGSYLSIAYMATH